MLRRWKIASDLSYDEMRIVSCSSMSIARASRTARRRRSGSQPSLALPHGALWTISNKLIQMRFGSSEARKNEPRTKEDVIVCGSDELSPAMKFRGEKEQSASRWIYYNSGAETENVEFVFRRSPSLDSNRHSAIGIQSSQQEQRAGIDSFDHDIAR